MATRTAKVSAWGRLAWGKRAARAMMVAGSAFGIAASFLVWNPEAAIFLRSYDLLSWLTAVPSSQHVVLIDMDDRSYKELGQSYRAWDRGLHAALVRFLGDAGAAVIVFDIQFSEHDPGSMADLALAKAMAAQGRVVLAADQTSALESNHLLRSVQLPHPVFFTNAFAVGLSQFYRSSSDGVIRLHPEPLAGVPSLAEAAVRALRGYHFYPYPRRQWLRYYLSRESVFPRLSYTDASNAPPEFYRGKIVVIGNALSTLFPDQVADHFPTPITIGSHTWITGHELHATAITNLLQGDALSRVSLPAEVGLCLVTSLLAIPLQRMSSVRRALGHCFLMALGITAISVVCFSWAHLWFAWTAVLAIQLPLLGAGMLTSKLAELKAESEWVSAPLKGLEEDEAWKELALLPKANELIVETAAALDCPGYRLLRQIGRGAYGDVWLACDALGAWKAVKIVRSIGFDSEARFQRELRGLQSFTPVSRQHPGLVHILHADHLEGGKAFYYVMELADDERGLGTIDPNAYSPMTLSRLLATRGPLDWRRSAQIVSALADGVAYLHSHGLLHRDIKPSNVIFVSGRPKLADVGLVAEHRSTGKRASFVGTEGFVPPEGPGSMAADVFALGKVLQCCLQSRSADVDVAGSVAPSTQAGAQSEMHALQEIFRRATAEDPRDRFESALTLVAALDGLMSQAGPK